MAKHTSAAQTGSGLLQPWVPGTADEAAFGSWPVEHPPVPPAAAPAPPTSRRVAHALGVQALESAPSLRDIWWERLRYAAADVLAAGALSNRLVAASAAAEAPVITGRRIVVLGATAGAWTSILSALLAHVFGSLRREAVLAVDFSGRPGLLQAVGADDAPQFSTAATAPAARHARTLAELLGPESACGNQVFALSSGDVGRTDPQLWSAASSLFSRFAAVTLVDAGTSPESPETAAVLRTAHAAVVVAPDDAAGDEREAAVRRAVSGDFPELPLLTVWTGSAQPAEAGGELVLPYDHHLSTGSAKQLGRLGAHTRISATEIAAAVLTAANRK